MSLNKMKTTNFQKMGFHFRSIQLLFLAGMVLLIMTISLPGLFSGLRLIDNLIGEFGHEMLTKELHFLIEPVNLRYKTLERIGLEDSNVHLEEIKVHALNSFSKYHYKNTGSVFVISKKNQIILSKDWSDAGEKDFTVFFSGLENSKQLFSVTVKGKNRVCVGQYYPRWQSYVGIIMDQQELFAAKDNFVKSNVVNLIIALCVTLLFALVINQIIILPIIRLSRFADQVSADGTQQDMPGIFLFELRKMKNNVLRMVQTLTRREEKYRAVFNAPSEAMFIHSSHDGTVLEVNQAVVEMFGYPPEKLVGQMVEELSSGTPPYTMEEAGRKVKKALTEGPQRFEWVSKKKDGSLFWTDVSLQATQYGDDQVVLAVVRDINEKKQSEVALRESEDKFSKAFYLSPDAISISSLETGRLVDVNKGFEGIFGYTRDEVIGKTTLELGLFDIKSDRAKMVEILKEKGFVHHFETTGRSKDGSIFMGSISAQIVDVNEQKCLLTISHDITRQKKAEAELLSLRNYLANIIDSMPSVIIGVDMEGIITQWNNCAERSIGISTEEAVGQLLDQAIPDSISVEMEIVSKAIETRLEQVEPKRARQINGKTHYEDVTIYPLISNGVDGAVIRIDDVTEQVRLEEMMIQSEKMLSVGGLAAGMAHEINNPLAGMMQTANVMANRLGQKMDIPASQRAAEDAGTTTDAIRDFMEARGIPRMLSTINESGQRVAAIVENMLSFARKSGFQFSSHDLGELLERSLKLAATDYDLRKHYDFKLIKVKKEYETNMPFVNCEASKIQQVLLNLLSNGAQAMQEAGTDKPLFTIRTSFQEDRKMAIVEIEDNGPGMDEETRKRVFEPFFTTKSVGVGTGLGLSVSYFIITENHGGEMVVESQPGRGAKFIIRLPLKGKV